MNSAADSFSVIFLYSAMSTYALAFIAFSIDLANRSAQLPAHLHIDAGARVTTRTATLPATTTPTTTAVRVAGALTVLSWLLHAASTVLRGYAAERLPWANMYEFALTGTLVITTVFLALLARVDLRYLGTFITGLVLVLLGISTVGFYVPVAPLPPALQSYWLVIHVFVAITATAFFAIGFALSAGQLAKSRWDRGQFSTRSPRFRFLGTLPSSGTLETLAYRITLVGFVLWSFTLIAGAVWADRAWGRYWGWDTKEVWTFIVWVMYAGYIHARATRGWRGTRSAWLGIVGFFALLFNFGIVNVFFNGLHSYSGL